MGDAPREVEFHHTSDCRKADSVHCDGVAKR
jgi:hypothetical protein